MRFNFNYWYEEFVALLALIGIGLCVLLSYIFLIMLTPWFWVAVIIYILFGR